jgi:hypothetical protein
MRRSDDDHLSAVGQVTGHPADTLWQPRLGLDRDPCWQRYWRWDWGRLPLTFPACTVEAEQRPLGIDGFSITVRMARGVPMVCRIDDEEGRVLAEILPEPETGRMPHQPVMSARTWQAGEVRGRIGIGFDWVFFCPIRTYQPTKPLGIVGTAVDRLLGSEVVVSILRKPPLEEIDETY